MAKKSYEDWLSIYYELTAKGRKVATLWQDRMRASLWGAIKGWKYGEVNVLGYFRKHKTQTRSLAQIWSGMEFGVTRNEMLKGIRSLTRKGFIRRT